MAVAVVLWVVGVAARHLHQPVGDRREEVEQEEEEAVEERADVQDAACTKTRKQVLKRLRAIGRCSMGYAWDTSQERPFAAGSGSCGHCSRPCRRGYVCCGGSHYICTRCVNG